jgi:hypothetical protein
MPATYDKIATTTLSSAVSSFTFTSIPQTYTDLILISSALGETGVSYIECLQFNGSTNGTYSNTFAGGYVSSSGSNRNTNVDYIFAAHLNGYFTTGVPMTGVTYINNYSNTTTFKTTFSRGGSPATDSAMMAGLWRATLAIDEIKIFLQSTTNLQAGSTFTLYGIKAA